METIWIPTKPTPIRSPGCLSHKQNLRSYNLSLCNHQKPLETGLDFSHLSPQKPLLKRLGNGTLQSHGFPSFPALLVAFAKVRRLTAFVNQIPRICYGSDLWLCNLHSLNCREGKTDIGRSHSRCVHF